MTELRDVGDELVRLRTRLVVAALVVLAAFALIGARLGYLQVVRHEALAVQAKRSADFLASATCREGQIGAEYTRTMSV